MVSFSPSGALGGALWGGEARSPKSQMKLLGNHDVQRPNNLQIFGVWMGLPPPAAQNCNVHIKAVLRNHDLQRPNNF